MAKARYSNQVGTRIFIGVAIGILVLAIAILVGSMVKSKKFNDFKNEVSGYTAGVKSKITLDYEGESKELSKKEFSRMFMTMISARSRRDFVSGADILETITVRFTQILDEESVMTISKTNKPYVKVTYQSKDSNYTYWFQCSYDYILTYAGLKG